MSSTDATAAVVDHLESMSTLHPDQSETYTSLSNYLSHRLYHQLSTLALSHVSDPSNVRPNEDGSSSFLSLYVKVILPVSKRLNQLTFARVAAAVSRSLLLDGGAVAVDASAGRTLLEDLLAPGVLDAPAATYAECSLHLFSIEGAGPGAADFPCNVSTVDSSAVSAAGLALGKRRSLIETEGGNDIDNINNNNNAGGFLPLDGPDAAIVRARYHLAAAAYRRIVGPPSSFYSEAIRYLRYAGPIGSIPLERRQSLASDLCVAALSTSGGGVSELTGAVHRHGPLLDSLVGTKRAWLPELMRAAVTGDVSDANRILSERGEDVEEVWPGAGKGVCDGVRVAREKVSLLALAAMAFERPPHDRTIALSEIAERVGVTLENVEGLVMRALSLGLVRGEMDGVDGTLDVTYVVPRVLNSDQTRDLADRFETWAGKVEKIRDVMAENVPAYG